MNTKTISLALKSVLPLVLFVWLPSTAAARNYEGSGTYEDPYLIKTEADFRAVVDEGYVNKYFRLENDLNLNGRSWSVLSALRSTIDGAGHTISNFTLSEAMFTSIAAGSKTTVNDSTVYNGRGELRNLIISNVTANFNNTNGGAVFTRSNNGSIVNCHVKSSTLSGYQWVAAIARDCTINGVIDSCGVWSSTTISCKKHSGGLVAKLSNGTIRNSYFNGTINASAADYNEAKSLGEYGSDGIGAIVGYMERGTVAYCTAAGTINSNLSIVGGVVGRIYYKNAHVNNNLSATVLNMAAKNPYTTSYAYVGQLIGWLPIAASGGENTVDITNNHSWRVSSNNSGGKIKMVGDPRGGYNIISSWDPTGYGYSYNDINRISIASELQGKMFITCSNCVATDNTIYSPNWGYSTDRSPESQSDYKMYPDFRYNGPDAVLSSITLTKSGSNDITGVRSTDLNYLIIRNATAYNGYTLSGMTTTPCSGTFDNGSTWRLDQSTLTMYVTPGSDGVAGLDVVNGVVGGNALSQLITHAKIAPGTKKLGRSLFQSCHFLEDAELPEGLEELGDISFNYCYNLKEIKLPSSLKTIGKNVFTGCTRLSNVNLGDATQLESIGDDAFTYCKSLKELVIPASVKRIGRDAFEVGDGSVLEKITFMYTDQIPAEFERYSQETYIHYTAFPINKAVAIHTQNAEMAYQLMNLRAFARGIFPNATYYWDDSQSTYEHGYLQISTERDLHTFIAFINGWGNQKIKAKLQADFNMKDQSLAQTFSGTLDGNGHTFYGLNQPLFPAINGAAVWNLRLEGSINGGNTPYMGSLARIATGMNAISKVVSTVSLSSTIDAIVPQDYNGDPYRGPAYYGGLIGHIEEGSNINISNCLYRGAMTGLVAVDQDRDPKTTHFSGLVGKNDGTLNIESCLTQPTKLNFDDYYATFAYGNAPTVTTCYYFDDVKRQNNVLTQGIRVNDGTATNILVSNLGSSWGITDNDEAIVKLFTKVTWSGSGTAASPFTISNEQDLQLFITKLSKKDNFTNQFVELREDLDLQGVTFRGYTTDIASMESGFLGSFDGKGHTISNLTINQPNQLYIGVIRKMGSGAQLKNLRLKKPTISGSSYVGTLVGQAVGGTIENCVVEQASVSAKANDQGDRQYGGILLGYSDSTSVTLTKNFYFNARCDVMGVGTVAASEDVPGAEKALRLLKGKNIATLTPVTEGMLPIDDALTLVPARLASFQMDITPSIRDNSSRHVIYGADGGTNTREEGEEHFTLTPDPDGNGTMTPWAGYTSIWEVGNGNSYSPYEIVTADDLLALIQEVNVNGYTYSNSYFNLMADIDMNDITDFQPIGYGEGKMFSGNFNGNGHTISNLHFADSTSQQGIGFFGHLDGGVYNLTLVRPDFTGSDNVGALAGKKTDGKNHYVNNNFVINATINCPGEHKGLLIGSSPGTYDSGQYNYPNYYHRLNEDTTAVWGSFPEKDAHVMYSLTADKNVTLSNIIANGQRVVNDTLYIPFNTQVTLDLEYDYASDDSFLGRYTDGNSNNLTNIQSQTWQFTNKDSLDIVITPVLSTLSGYCGTGLKDSETFQSVRYRYDQDEKTLYLYGFGAMCGFTTASQQFWWSVRDSIESITVEEGITQIGKLAFSGNAATEVNLPSTLKTIGESALQSMRNLRTLTLRGNAINSIGKKAFYSCSNLRSIALPQCTKVPVFSTDILKLSDSCKIYVPNKLLASFMALKNLSAYKKNRILGFTYPADKVTVTASMAEPVNISSEGVTPAKVNVSAVIKEPATVVFNEAENHSFTFNEFTEENPFVVFQAEGINTKPAQGKTSVSVDGGNYTLDFYNSDDNKTYADDLGVVYAGNYKVVITPEQDKATMIGETTSKDDCNRFFVEKNVEGLAVFSIFSDYDKDRVSYTASAEPVAARDTLYFPAGTQFDLTYTPKKATYIDYGDYGYWEQADDPIGDDQFVAFRANVVKGWNYYGTPWYGLSSAEMDYIDATHSTLTLFDEDAFVIASVMDKSNDECDIIPEKGEIFFHTTKPSFGGDHYNGDTYRWDKAAHIVKTIYFDETIEEIPQYCFSDMDRLEEVYFFGKNMPTFYPSVSGVVIGCERTIYLPEDAISDWTTETTCNYFKVDGNNNPLYVHGELQPIPATTIVGMEVSLTVNGEPCTLYEAAHDETPEVPGGTYEITYNGNSANDRVKSCVLDGGYELDDTEHYSLRAFRVGDDEDRDGTDIHDLKDAGTYRLKIVGTRFHKGTIDLCNLVIKQAPFESITYGTLPDRKAIYDFPFTFEYGWMDEDWKEVDCPFIFNGEPLEVYHYGSAYEGDGKTCGDDEFYLIYSDNTHPGQAGLTLKSRNHNFTEGEHTIYFTLLGDEYSGEWGDLVWNLSPRGVLTIKPKEGLTEAAMIEAEPVEGDYAGYNDLKVYPWFQTYFENGMKNEHHNDIVTINVCEGVTNIATDAFCDGDYTAGWGSARYKNLKTIYLPESVHSIGDHAFDSQYVKNIVFAHTTGVPPLTNSNAFPTRDDCLIWVNGNLYSSAIVAENWVEHKDQIVTEYVDIPVGTFGMRTFSYPFPLDFTQQEALNGQTGRLRAYVATSGYASKTDELTFTGITDVPGFTGLLLKGDAGTYRVPTRIIDDIVKNNLLTAVVEDTEVEAKPRIWQEIVEHHWGYVYYVNFILANGSNGVGFYPLEANGTIGANKAYLTLRENLLPTNGDGSRGIKLLFDDGDQTQNIESPETAIREIDNDVWFDLNGKRLSAKPTRSGLYIHNGKKIFVK